MMQLLRLSWWLMRRRLRRAWGLSAAAVLGILSAVTLLSAAAVYSQALAEAGVRHALFSQTAAAHHVQALAQSRPLGPEDYARLRQVVEGVVQRRIGGFVAGQERFGRTWSGMGLSTNPALGAAPPGSPAGRPFFMTGFAEHSRIVEGSWPRREGTSGAGGVELDAVLGVRAARDMGYGVGSRLFVTPFRAAPEERIVLNVVGVAEPVNPRDDYWLGYPGQFSVQTVGETLVVPIYVTESDFLQVLGRRFATAIGDFGFNVFVDPAAIRAGDVDAVMEALDGLETDINKEYPRTFVFSRLGLTLREFQRDLTLARVPLYVFVSLAVIIVLYFLMLAGRILGRSQAAELGLLRGRGASVGQVCGALLLADGMIALAAAGVGPLLGWLAVRFLLLPLLGNPGGGGIEVGLSRDAFWMGGLGAGLAAGALAAATAGRARTGIAEDLASLSRPPAVSFFHRYYLDVPVLLGVGVVWWQFQQRDGFVSGALADRGLEVDPALILAPGLGLLAAALVLMRVLPLLARLAVGLGMRWGPGWASITLAPLARDPALPVALAALLMLAAALGVFGAAFQSSLTRSQSDQVKYRMGGEMVVAGPGVSAGLSGALAVMPEVRAATPVLRDAVRLAGEHSDTPALLIAADPDAMAYAAWFRDDFADAGLPELTARIRPGGAAPALTALPGGAERIGVWLKTDDLAERELQAAINVWARLTDGEGRYRNVSLGGFGGPGRPAPEGWRFYGGELPALGRFQDVGMTESGRQWHLAAIFFSTSSFVKVSAGRVYMDDFTVFGPSLPERGLVVEGFDVSGRWTPLGMGVGVPDRAETVRAAARSGAAGLVFAWESPFGGEQRGVHLPPAALPIPAIGSPGLYRGQNVRIRHGRGAIPVEVAGVSSLFPGVTDFRRPFLWLDIESYLTYLRFLPPGNAETTPQEIWLSLNPAYDRSSAVAAVTAQLPPLVSLASRDDAAAGAARNPLAGGGWDGLAGLVLAAVGLAVAAAMLLHSLAVAQARRTDMAVARALGLSRRQMFLSLAAESWLMGGAAIAVGAAIGYWPGMELTQLLALTPDGGTPVPPVIPEVNAALLVGVIGGLASAVTASAVVGALLAWRDRPADALRAEA